MQKRLFLTSPVGCGKSDMIRTVLGDRISRAGGFVTLRRHNSQGGVEGYELMAANGTQTPQRFLDLSTGTPQVRVEVFSQTGSEILEQARHFPFAVMDEIGGVELLDEGFLGRLAGFLRSDTPCIGVVKAEGPVGKLVELMGVNLRYRLVRQSLLNLLYQDPHTLVLPTTGWDDPRAWETIRAWADEYAR